MMVRILVSYDKDGKLYLSQAKKAHNTAFIIELQKTKRQLKRDLKAQIKEFWESREHIYNKHTHKVGKKGSVDKELRSTSNKSRLNNIKQIYKLIARLTDK
jgi:shikimate kinase